ncbi:putative ankyrin repeat-containing protein [Trichoderma velutinum]
MRLLNTDTLEIEEFGFGEIPHYAILSHRWYQYELNLQDVEGRIWTKKEFTNEIKIRAFEKINQCCIRAKSDAFQYVWIDSCCIDKTSSAELSEAINSMYLWYYKADRCYAYLSDVQSMDTFKESEWFARGWTLQELLAPAEVYFLDKDWHDLGTKKSLQEAVSDRTRIPANILSGADLETATVAQRMSWASSRKTTRIEDRAYCLMGIFGINMPLLYGEGERAFIRLQEEIMKISNDHSIFAWKSTDRRGGLLATSPEAFSDSGNIIHYSLFGESNGPLTVSSRGIDLELRFIGIGRRGLGIAILHCTERDKKDKPLAIYVRDTTLTMELFERVESESFEWVDLRKFRKRQYPRRKICIRTGRVAPMGRAEDSGSQGSISEDFYDKTWLSNVMSTGLTDELFRAAQAGERDHVWLLLTRSDVTANSVDYSGQTVLLNATIGGHEALVKILLARSDVNADFQTNEGQTPLSWVAQHGHEAIAKLLLEKSVDIEAISQKRTPLLWAAMNGHEAVVKLLLEKGADTEATNRDYSYNKTSLMWASENGHEAVVKLLLEYGANIDARVKHLGTPLFRAAENGHEAVVRLLLENGADVEAGDDFPSMPLLQAAGNGHEAVVKLLLENGADIERMDYYGKTPLLHAADNGHEGIVQLLLKNGANIETRDCYQKTALLHAAQRKHEDVVRLLLENGADIEAEDSEGQTLRSWAVTNQLQGTIELLNERY